MSVSREMPRYQCHKQVWALKIADVKTDDHDIGGHVEAGALVTPVEPGFAPFRVDASYRRRHQPEVGGYYVVYDDGYKSYSPAKAFEDGYTLLPSLPQTTLIGGGPVTEDHHEIDPATGMQKGYVVLSQEERAKGFVRPLLYYYTHVGPPRPSNLRDLTAEERERHAQFNYAKYENYPETRSPVLGRFWTQADLDRLGAGCNKETRMGYELAATYARDFRFYSGTFCSHCKKHFPVGENGEFVWTGTDQRVGT